MQQGCRECGIEGPSSNFGHQGVFFSDIFTSGVRFFPKFSPQGGVFSEIYTSGGVFFRNFEKWRKITQPRAREITQPLCFFSENFKNGRKSRNLVRAKSPNLSVLVVGMVLTTCPGPTVMGSQKYFKSRKCQGWVSSRGYAV